eukprot:jgi/Astpho2/4840/Aster-07535
MPEGHGNVPHQQRQVAALPVQLPAQDFLCQPGFEEVDRAAHAAAAQELVSFPITLDDEATEPGDDLEADDALLSDQHPAAQTRPEERQHLHIDEPAPDDKAAEQEVASSVRAVANSPLSARLQKESLQSQAHEPADDVPVGMQEPQVASRMVDPVRKEAGVGTGSSLLPGKRSLLLDGVTTAYRYVHKDEGTPARFFWNGAPACGPPDYEYTFRARHADGPPSVNPLELTVLSHSDYESKCSRKLPEYQGHLTSTT